MPGEPRRRDREGGHVVLRREPVDDGVQLRVVRVVEEDPGEELGLERRPGLQRDPVDAAVVDDATAVERHRLLERVHVHPDTLRDRRRVGDRDLDLVGDEILLDRRLEQVDLPRGVVRDAERTHLAGRLERVERAGDLLRLDERVGAMEQQHVDVVGPQRLQRSLDRRHDPFVREVEVRAVLTRHDARLGLQGDLGALRRRQLQRLGEPLLRAMHRAAVHVGVVEEVDAGIPRGGDEVADLVVGLVGDAHHAGDDVRGLAAGGAEGHVLHGNRPSEGGGGPLLKSSAGRRREPCGADPRALE
jgi:hypothetical protein